MANSRYNKDEHIRIFYLLSARDENGFKITIKKYIHPINGFLWAYVRDLSQKEVQARKQVQNDATIQVRINRREITNDMFMEYKRPGMKNTNTYNISGIDFFDDSQSEIKFDGSLISQAITYDRVEGTDWK